MIKNLNTALLFIGLANLAIYFVKVTPYNLHMGQSLILTAGVLQLIWGSKK